MLTSFFFSDREHVRIILNIRLRTVVYNREHNLSHLLTIVQVGLYLLFAVLDLFIILMLLITSNNNNMLTIHICNNNNSICERKNEQTNGFM